MTITDPDDERLADFFDLADPAARRRRERNEMFVAEGLIAVQRLIESPHEIRSILVTPRHRRRVEELPGTSAVPILVADDDVVARTVGFDFHRGVIASAQRRPLPAVADVVSGTQRIAVLEGLNDPENLGLIARSARAFGVEALILDPTCIDPYYRRTVRVSMGEVLLLDVARADDWPADIEVLHAAGFETWAMTPDDDATSIWEIERARTARHRSRRRRLRPAGGDPASVDAAGPNPDQRRRRLGQRRSRRGDRLRHHGAGEAVNPPRGDDGTRTHNPHLAKVMRYQLRHVPEALPG